jgi:hypothetical protein
MTKRKDQARLKNDREAFSPEEARADFVMERVGSLHDADRSFDVEYWQRQGDAAIFQAAWELAELYHLDRGMTPDELRLQRTIEHVERL